jgi:hypothetical protein
MLLLLCDDVPTNCLTLPLLSHALFLKGKSQGDSGQQVGSANANVNG